MSESSRDVERKVEASRANIDQTIEEIRSRMSIGQIVDEAVDYFGTSGASEMASRFTAQVRENPLPLALVGIGLAWLMSGRGHPHFGGGDGDYAPREYGSRYRGGQGDRGREGFQGSHEGVSPYAPLYRGDGDEFPQDWSEEEDDEDSSGLIGKGRERVTDALSGAAETARSGFDAAASAASSTMRSVRDAASSGMRGGRRAYRGGRDYGNRAYGGAYQYGSAAYRDARNGFADLLEREPLVVGALGVAVGAAIGAMLPRTSVEDRYLGETRDRLMEEAAEAAREQLDRVERVAERAWDAASEEAETQGLTPDALGGRVNRVLERTEEAIAEEVKGETKA